MMLCPRVAGGAREVMPLMVSVLFVLYAYRLWRPSRHGVLVGVHGVGMQNWVQGRERQVPRSVVRLLRVVDCVRELKFVGGVLKGITAYCSPVM